MRRTSSWLLCAVVLVAGFGGLASCGGGQDVAVRVGHTPITRATVGHWMEVLVAGDYRNETAKPPLVGLASDPPTYGRCVAAANHLSKHAESRKTESLCRQLYQAIKRQAVNFLTNALWYEEDAREHGEKVTNSQIERKYRRMERREFPAPGQFARYLAEQHRTKADEYYLIKRNLLSDQFVERLQRQHVNLRNRALALKLAAEWQAKWTARTSCQPSYVASQCKQYKGPETVPAPDNVLEQLTK